MPVTIKAQRPRDPTVHHATTAIAGGTKERRRAKVRRKQAREMVELTLMERMDRMIRRQQKLQPAGTKRKIPEPPTRPPLRTAIDSINGARRQLSAEMCQAVVTSAEELLREADEYLANQQQQQCANEHLDMEQG